ncbi:MAG: trans-aconitate methyltransferase [Chlamydiales bacterium]|jgi:trans-aconitate methyltransferase
MYCEFSAKVLVNLLIYINHRKNHTLLIVSCAILRFPVFEKGSYSMKKFILSLLFTAFSCNAHAMTMDMTRYHNHSSIQWVWAVQAIYGLELKGDERLLDIGTGDGKIAAYLSTLVPEGSVIGIDILDEAITYAQKKFPKEKHPNLSFEWGKAETYLGDEAFDIITAFCSFNWIEEKDVAFTRIIQNLKVGGKALIVIPELIDHTGVEMYREYIEEAGLKCIRMEKVRRSCVLRDKSEMKSWLLAIDKKLSELPKEVVNTRLDPWIKELRDRYPQAGDGRFYAFPYVLEILVEKPKLTS